MKTKISRIGKKSLSVVIALMMIVSTMLVGMVTTNAATSVTLYFASATTVTFKAIGYNGSDKTVTLQKVDGETYNGMQVYKTTEFDDSYYYLHIQYGNEARQDNKINNSYFSNYDGKIYDEKTGTWSTYSGGSSTEPSESFYLEYWHNNKHNFIKYNSYSDGVYTWETKFDFGQFASDGKFRLTNSETWTDNQETTFCVPAYKMSNSKSTSSYVNVTASGVSVVTKSSEFGSDAGSWGHSKYYDIKLKNIDTNKTYVVTYEPGKSNSLDGTITIADKSSITTTYNITKGNEVSSQGTFSVDKTTAAENDAVTVTTSPASGYEVDKVTYTPEGGSAITVPGSNNTYTFAMPAAKVTVNVSFKATPTPTTTYYLTGRFGIKKDGNMTYLKGKENEWEDGNTSNIKFTQVPDSTLYKLETGQTIKELAANTGDNIWYFQISDGTTKYRPDTGADKELTISNNNTEFGTNTNNGSFYFTGNDETGNVTLYFDSSTKKFYFEVEGGSTTKGAFEIKDKTAVNGSLSFSAEGKTAGTADAGNTVNVTAKPYAGFTCSGITVSYTNKTTSETVTLASTGSGNNYSFVVPADLTTDITTSISVAATFTLDKVAYIKSQGDGLWIDVAPNENDSTATLIKWNNYSGSNHETTSTYIFYVPKNVDLTNANIYNGYGSAVNLNGTSIPADNKAVVSLTKDTTYTTSGGVSASVKAMQGSTNAMFLYTTKGDAAYSLPTKTGAGETKDSVKSDGGSCKTMTDTTDTAKQFSAAMALDSVKGRGNSSWEASNKLFGKYAFNMKLASKTNLFGMDMAGGSSGSKSWCLLANNADESMLRNALTYQLAADIGIQDSPEFRFVDIYDNGEYLGSYLVTEKVDVGKSKLVKGTSFEDLNEEGAKAEGATKVKEDTVKSTYTYGGSNYSMQYAKVSPNDVTSDSTKYPSETKGKYLLEFELKKRLLPPDGDESRTASEASWFRSPRGQYVVVKSPEFATKEQVTYIAQKFAEMENMIFTSDATQAQLSTVMDVESFAKMYLIQEFSSNLDSAATSYYMTFDCAQTNPVFVANPVWDYDWAYGQYENKVKKDVNDTLLDSADPKAWFAKSKQIGDNEADSNNKYSIQSQLATNNSDFKSVVRKVWEQENGFYDNIKKYYGDNSQIDAWYNQIKDSVDMNETRWGFIASDPLINISTGSWGSKNTGANHAEAVYYLENTWTKVRAEEFLNTESGLLNSEYAPYTPAKPAISAYNADLSATITSPINSGTDFVIKVTSDIESGVKYRLYEGSSSAYLYENSDGVFVVNATEAGTKSYTVKAVYGSTESEASSAVSVTVIAPADLEGVSLSVSNTSVNVNEEFTLTATADPVGVTGVKYTFYKDNVAIASDITSNTYTTKLTVQGTADYKVKATANGKSFVSSVVTVTAAKVAQVHDFRVYFKCASAPAYKPYVSLDGATAVEMTRGTELGKNYAGTLTFFWYYADFSNVDSADTHTLTFTSKRTKLKATMKDNFANSEYYLAVDNLMTGTEVVDLTGSLVYVRNFFHSATNLVYSGVGTDKTLGFTNIDGEMYKMGTVVNTDGTLTFSVKSATTMQMLTAELTTVSETQQAILDVNLDGKVDIKDATLMQMALVS